MARDPAKLARVSQKISDEYKVKTMTVVYDFSKLATKESVRELKEKLAKEITQDVSILVNNVGCSTVGLLGK